MVAAYREGCMYENRVYERRNSLWMYNIQHGEHGRVLPGSFTAQRVSWMLDECGVWPSSPGVDVKGLGLLGPLKSWRPRLPKILFPVTPANIATFTIRDYNHGQN